MATIILNNITPALLSGEKWIVKYLKRGSTSGYTTAGPFTTLPISITTTDPAGTEYEGVVQTDCGTGIFSNPYPFSQTPAIPDSCKPVTNLTSSTSATSIALSWDAASNSYFYIIRYKNSIGASQWTYAYTNDLQYVINGLNQSTQYDVEVYTTCNKTDITATTGVPQPYCGPLSIGITDTSTKDGCSYSYTIAKDSLNTATNHKLYICVSDSYYPCTDFTYVKDITLTNGTYTENVTTEVTCDKYYFLKIESDCGTDKVSNITSTRIATPCTDENNPRFELTTQNSMNIKVDVSQFDSSFTIRLTGPNGYDNTINHTVVSGETVYSANFTGLVPNTEYVGHVSKTCIGGYSYTYLSTFPNTTSP